MAIRIIFKIDCQRYASSNSITEERMKYGEWIEREKKFYPNALLINKAFENFESIFGITFDRKDELIAQKVKVFPAKAGKYFYLEFEFGGFSYVN